jgi:hypothetical protein
MKKIITFLNFASIVFLINAGVSTDTLVDTPEGSKEINSLKAGDKVISLNTDFSQNPQPVITIEQLEINSYVEIITEDDVVIRVSPDQRLFVPQKWVQADQLSLGDVLLKKDLKLIRIKSICLKQEPIKLFFITVEKHKNFLASKNGVLIHNGVGGATVGFWTGWIVSNILFEGAYVDGVSTCGCCSYYGIESFNETCSVKCESSSRSFCRDNTWSRNRTCLII